MLIAQFVAIPEGVPLFIVIVAVVLLVTLVRTASMNRRHTMETDQRICRGCGATHPTFAAFCRRCGRRL